MKDTRITTTQLVSDTTVEAVSAFILGSFLLLTIWGLMALLYLFN